MDPIDRRRALGAAAGLALGTVLSACGGGGEEAAATSPREPDATGSREQAAVVDADGNPVRVVGYSDEESYAPGQTITLYLSAERLAAPQPWTWRLWRFIDATTIAQCTVTIGDQPSRVALDQQWTASMTLPAPAGPSGMYYLTFDGSTGARLYFVLREPPQERRPLLVIVSTATAQAYNSYGGQSLYGFNSVGGSPARIVSRHRPIHPAPGTSGTTMDWDYQWLGVAPLVGWLTRTGRAPAMATDVDLHRDPTLLQGRRCLVLAGHDEYWSTPMRDAVDRFVAAGGNVMNLGGNTAYWQIRYEDDARTIVGYKEAAAQDAVADPALRTTWWHALGRSAATTFGSAPEFGAYNSNALASLPFTAYRTAHWAYAGTELSDGTRFAADLPIATYEVDGVDVVWDAGLPSPRPGGPTPANYLILAWTEATGWWGLHMQPGNMAMGIRTAPGGGSVFSGGTVQWGMAFRQAAVDGSVDANPIVRITHNVLLHFMAPALVQWRSSLWETYAYRPEGQSPGYGWQRVGTAFYATTEAIDDQQVPLYRDVPYLSLAPVEMLTTHARPDPGWRRVGIVGWVYAQPADDRRQVWAFARWDLLTGVSWRYDLDPTPARGEQRRGVMCWAQA